jgi:hypothetical protein
VDELEAVAIDQATGKLATCSTHNIYVYQPYSVEYGVYKVGDVDSSWDRSADRSSGRCRAV